MTKVNKKIYYPQLGVHTYMKNLIDNPPTGYEFLLKDNTYKKNLVSKLNKNNFLRFIYKNIVRNTFNVFPLINKIYYDKFPKDTDLILSTGTIIKEEKPWIMKILDTPFSMAGNNYKVFKRNIKEIKSALASNYCKRIIVHTDRAKKHMEEYFSEEVTKKIIKVSPAIPSEPFIGKKPDKEFIQFLFMGSINNPNEFFMKGGLETLETFKVLSKKYDNIKLIIRCKIPDEIREKYKLRNIEFLEEQLPFEKIKEIYRDSDLLIMPGYGGYFVMAYLEAFSYGLPIIALDTYGCDDFIKNGVTGFLIKPSEKAPIDDFSYPSNTRSPEFVKIIKEGDERVISDLVEKCSELIENRKLIEKMSKNCHEAFRERFSFDKKIKILGEIFREALR